MVSTEMASTNQEHWRWIEERRTLSELNWKTGAIITAGIDVGSVSTQAVVLVDGKLYAFANARTGSNSSGSAERALSWALDGTGMRIENIHSCVGTGYGRVNVPMAERTMTEISCHARGANFIYGSTVRTVLDMGGQDCKVIRCDEKGRVTKFIMNDKCAAGTGRGMEVFAELLAVPINEIGDLSFEIDGEPPPVSATCVILAKTEALGLLRKRWPKNKVIAAYCAAMAFKVVTLLRRAEVEKDFAITGGIAKNRGVVERIEREINLTALSATTDPQLAGGIGAALLAKELVEKRRAQGGSKAS